MNHLRSISLILIASSLFGACKKEKKSEEFTIKEKILGTWSRVERAYDLNGNHILDSNEAYHAPATDTLLFYLLPNNTYQRIQVFKSQQFITNGSWHLQNNDVDLVTMPTTSTSATDTVRIDTASQVYFRYHTTNASVWYWEGFRRPN